MDATFAELLRDLDELDESTRIEAKRGSDIGKSILETICAFSNEPGLGGGYLLLGVERDEDALPGFGGYRVCGVADPDGLQQRLVAACNQQFSTNLRPEIRPDLHEGQVTLTVFVPEADPANKPVYLTKQGLSHGAFRRIGSSDVHCTQDDLAALFGARGTKPYDQQPIPDSDLSDLSPEAIALYRRRRSSLKRDASELEMSDMDLLRALGCLASGESGGQLTVAGLFLFGSPLALRRLAPLHRIEYIVAPGREWGEGMEEELVATEFRESLLTVLPRIERLVGNDLPRTTLIPVEGIAATSETLIPERALREGIVNAAMHRDYQIASPVQIIRYANRLEIRNPGYSLKPVESLGQPGSVPRNPTIAAVLHDLNYAESKGSGVQRMIGLMEGANLSRPFFDSDRRNQTFSLTFLTHHFLPEDRIEWLTNLRDLSLFPEEAYALVFAREFGSVSNSILRAASGLDTLNASRRLQRLRSLGLLEAEGAGSATIYRPGPRLTAFDKESESGQPLSGNLDALSGNPDALSGNPEAQSGNLASLGGGSGEPEPPELRRILEKIGPRASDPKMVEEAILALVTWRPMNAEEIATRMRRRKRSLQDHYLTPLLRSGRIALVYPERVNHPEQRYLPGEHRAGR